MSDIENEEIQESGEKLAPPPGSDYEVPYTFHSETPLERSYDKADHWVKVGVRPNQIYLDDGKLGVINFRKEMRDPLLIKAGIVLDVLLPCLQLMWISYSQVCAITSQVQNLHTSMHMILSFHQSRKF